MPLPWSLYSPVITFPFLCGPQNVSAPCSVTFFPYLDLSLLLRSPESQSLAWSLSFLVLTCPFLCGLQRVSATYSVPFLQCSEVPLLPRSPACEYSFILLMDFQCTSVFLPLCVFSECEPFFYLCLPPVFSLLCLSAPQIIFDKLQWFNSNVLLILFLILSWFHQCTFSRLSVYPVITHITP